MNRKELIISLANKSCDRNDEALKNLDDKESMKVDYTLEKIIATRGDCKDKKDGTICIAVTEYKWLIEHTERLRKENQSITERFHKQADYIINLEAKIERLK